MVILPNSYFHRALRYQNNTSLRSCSALKKWSTRLWVWSSRRTKFFSYSSLQNLAKMKIFFHVSTQSRFGPIIVNCNRISLIEIICNVADPFECVSIVISPSEIYPFGWQLHFEKNSCLVPKCDTGHCFKVAVRYEPMPVSSSWKGQICLPSRNTWDICCSNFEQEWEQAKSLLNHSLCILLMAGAAE